MLENPNTDLSATVNVAPVKRYSPPQRNRGLARRKSGGDRLERANIYTNDREKTQFNVSKNVPIVNHGDAGSSNRVSEISSVGLIPLHGCCNSEAVQRLNDRWTVAMNALNSLPDDSSERPVLYSRNGSPWGHAILPHLMMPAVAASGGLKKDFLSELRHAISNAKASSDDA